MASDRVTSLIRCQAQTIAWPFLDVARIFVILRQEKKTTIKGTGSQARTLLPICHPAVSYANNYNYRRERWTMDKRMTGQEGVSTGEGALECQGLQSLEVKISQTD